MKVWRRESRAAYGEQAVIHTVAVALWGLDKADSLESARKDAAALWENRDKTRL